jgi:flagellar basal-body rod protein FlgB
MRLSEMDRITSLLTAYLDVQSRRAEVVSGNLANVDTPDYKAKELEFQDYLETAAQSAVGPQTERKRLAALESRVRVEEQSGIVPGIDGNTVDAGREMSTLADAGIHFLAGAQMLQSRLRTLRMAIKEGR